MRKKKEEKTFHYSELQAYFAKIHECESSCLEFPERETFISEETMEHARHKQHKVKVGDKTYKSVAAAFEDLKLPMHKHQVFRKKLKAEKKAEFDGYVFELV
jgi:hypothetical protein